MRLQHLSFPNQVPTARDLDASLVREVLRKYRVKYIVLHKIGPHGEPIDPRGFKQSRRIYPGYRGRGR